MPWRECRSDSFQKGRLRGNIAPNRVVELSTTAAARHAPRETRGLIYMTVTVDTAFGTDITAGTWKIAPSHSEVGFTVRHLMSKVRGQFESFEGELTTGTSLEETRA